MYLLLVNCGRQTIWTTIQHRVKLLLQITEVSVSGASIWIHYLLHRLLFHGVDWASSSIQTARAALPAFLCTITLPGVILNSTFPLSSLVPQSAAAGDQTPPPKPTLCPLLLSLITTVQLVWLVSLCGYWLSSTHLLLWVRYFTAPNPQLPNLTYHTCHSATTNNE